MEVYIIRIVTWNFVAVTSLLTLFLFLHSDTTFDEKVRRNFYFASLSIIALILSDGIAMFFDAPTDSLSIQKLHTLFHAIAFAIKPVIVLFILFIVLRDRKYVKIIYMIPEFINIIVAVSALFGPWAFSYKDGNIFQRGILGYTPHSVALLYAVIIVNESLKSFKYKKYYEGGVVMWTLIVTMMAVVIDSLVGTHLVNSVSATCVTFYYFYFYFNSSKQDVMTDTFNRNAYYEDVKRFEPQITALMLFNMSDLNPRCEREGIDVWDESLMSMVNIVAKNVSASSRLYRIGGDEIAVLCVGDTRESVREHFDCIKNKMKETEYLFASGIAFRDRRDTTEELLARANESMRIDKSNIKVGRIYRQRLSCMTEFAH